MERASFTSFMTGATRDRVTMSQEEQRVSVILTWTLPGSAFVDELRDAIELRTKHGWPVVIVTLSSGASFAPDLWRALSQLSIRVVSLAEQYRDKVGTEGFAKAVLHALEAQDRGIGVRKKAARQGVRTQEEAAVDDLSAEEEEQLFEQLNAVHSR